MNCSKCGKNIDNPNGSYTIKGIVVKVGFGNGQKTPENIDYANKQLGKYSNGEGECDIAICYECYIDTLFHNF